MPGTRGPELRPVGPLCRHYSYATRAAAPCMAGAQYSRLPLQLMVHTIMRVKLRIADSNVEASCILQLLPR